MLLARLVFCGFVFGQVIRGFYLCLPDRLSTITLFLRDAIYGAAMLEVIEVCQEIEA